MIIDGIGIDKNSIGIEEKELQWTGAGIDWMEFTPALTIGEAS